METTTQEQPQAPQAAPEAPPAPAEGAAAPVETKPPAPPATKKAERWKPILSAHSQLLEAKTKLKEMEPKAQKLAAIEARLKEDPLGALAELGLDWNTLAQAKVKERERGAAPAPAAAPPVATPPPEVKQLETKVTEVTKRLDAAEQARQNAEKQVREEQYQAFVGSVQTAIQSEATTYPAIVALKAEGLVVREIEQQFAKDKTLLTAAEAAKRVEEKLRTELTEMRDKNPALIEVLFGRKVEGDAAPKVEVARKTGPRSLNATASVPSSAVAGQPPPKKEAPSPEPSANGRRKGFMDHLKQTGRYSG